MHSRLDDLDLDRDSKSCAWIVVGCAETSWRRLVSDVSTCRSCCCSTLSSRNLQPNSKCLLCYVYQSVAPAIRESNLRQVSMRSNRIGAAGGVWIGVMMRDYDDQPNKVIPINNEEQGFRRVFPGIVNPELLKRTRGIETLDVSDNDLRVSAKHEFGPHDSYCNLFI